MSIFLGVIAGFLVGVPVGLISAHMPWMAAQLLNLSVRLTNRVLISPIRRRRLASARGPTLEGSLRKLAHERDVLSRQLQTMLSTQSKVHRAAADRAADPTHSKGRLAAAEDALRIGIEARKRSVAVIDAVRSQLECHRFRIEIAAIALLPSPTAELARERIEELDPLEQRITEAARRAESMRGTVQGNEVMAAWDSLKAALRRARQSLRVLEERTLLQEASAQLVTVKPVDESYVGLLPIEPDADASDISGQSLRLEREVTQCIEQQQRVRFEISAIEEVNEVMNDAPWETPRQSSCDSGEDGA